MPSMNIPSADLTAYSGTSVLEVMTEAKNYNNYLLSWISDHIRPHFRVLDFGAGAGTFSLPLFRKGVELVCVEPDSALNAGLREAGLTVVDQLDAIADESMDLIYTLNVLEHIPDDNEAIRVLSRKLKPGGTALVYVPAFEILYSSFDAKIGHLRRYRRSGLEKLAATVGLKVKESRYADSAGFLAALLFRACGRGGDISPGAVKFYDQVIFPLSYRADILFSRFIGKNVLLVAVKE